MESNREEGVFGSDKEGKKGGVRGDEEVERGDEEVERGDGEVERGD